MNKQNPKVIFEVSLDEANKIFKALGNLPFNEVYELIGKLNDQANRQLAENKENKRTFIGGKALDIDEILK